MQRVVRRGVLPPSGAILAAIVAVLAAGLVRAAPPEGVAQQPSAADAPGCARYSRRPIATGHEPDELPELSGLAASRAHPGIFYAHNDSGNPFELIAVRENGELVARIPLLGGDGVDTEDIAVGPCSDPADGPWCVYLADTGDNLERRRVVEIDELPEPTRLDDEPRPVHRIRFSFPDGPHNAEALLVEPETARLFVITKTRASLGHVFRIDRPADGAVAEAAPVATLISPDGSGRITTGASVHPSGERVLLRTYTGNWEYVRPGATRLEDVLAVDPVRVPDAKQIQPEAIAYLADGRGYLLGSETGPLHMTQTLFRVDCEE
jgi:hypothetical protein